MTEFNWTCPFCNRAQTVSSEKKHYSRDEMFVGDSIYGKLACGIQAIGCSNPACKQVEITLDYGAARYDRGNLLYNGGTKKIRITPESLAKPLPDYIPQAIVQDYTEACRIKDLSPKASATLSRRCLQGMIRDFCEIKERTLFDEIKKLEESLSGGSAPKGVSIDSVDAIHAVRKIGNIGAHMEKDINVIVDVEPEEAQMMIDLIENLIDEWYVERNKRQARFSGIIKAAESKKDAPSPAADQAAAGMNDE